MTRLLSLLFSAALTAWPAAAHEFWISPKAYTIEPQDQLIASLRVGENFKGGGSPYLPSRFVRFDLVAGDTVLPVEGRIGDRPALDNAVPTDGLITVVHQTTDSLLTYREWQKFINFVEHKDFDGALEQHAARGLPETGFREVYSRYGKALIAVGRGEGADREVGLLTEIVALANPYTEDLAKGLPIQVLYNGEPRIDAQVELFAKGPDGKVEITLHRTNADGQVSLPVEPGHEYLVDAVVLRPVEPETDRDPVWESLWASLTFLVPAK